MDLLIAFIIFTATMVGCLLADTTMILALLVGYACFVTVALRRGNKPAFIMSLTKKGIRDSLIVVLVLFLIGMLTASWRAGGTIMFFVYYGMKLIIPSLFLIITFLLTCLLSYAIGTSFGVVGTLGVIFMALARSGSVNEILAAGVIMSGIYFGDRCSPASSSMILTAAVTYTNARDNMYQLLRTAWLPTGICVVVYTFLSFRNPINNVDPVMFERIENDFSISMWLAVPALLMLILPLIKVDVKIAMGLSILSSAITSIFLQKLSLLKFLQICIVGYDVDSSSFGTMLNGGGLVSMLEICGIVMISCTYSDIFEGTGMIRDLQSKLEGYMIKLGRFPVTALAGLLFCAVFYNQTIATTMSASVLNQPYKNQGGTAQELAVDIGNSTIVLSGLVPWAIASTVPLSFMGVGPEALPYAIFLYAVPICYLFTKKRSLMNHQIDKPPYSRDNGDSVRRLEEW
ncbi:MAG: Na+/H+ antiporter NhaC family protein [Anaerovoracaceae bacterium]